ncbi:MAG: hypothetical protein JNK79_00415, partial [Chitinophagaceae bacterium]|nr:hypothetical protein [Chitinophagaceae bacterium]
FDSIKSALTGALDLVKSPMEFLKQAFALMNPGFLGTAWTALKSGARMMWQAIKAATDGVLKIGGGIWKTMSGYVDTLFASVGGLINNWLFRKLPDFMQEAARALYEKVKALWQTIRDFWMELWERLTKFVNDLLKSIESFVERVIAYAIDTVIKTVTWLRETYDYIQRFIDDPEGTLKPVVDAMVSKIRTEGPPKGDSVRQEKTAEAYAQSQAKKSGANGTIQRAPAGKVERSTASLDEVGEGLIAEMVNQWNTLDFGKLVWEGLKNAVYPPATIKAIGHEFYELWNTDWANAKNSLFMPRNIFEDFGGFFHDIWSNILILLDFPLALWRRLNNVLMLLMFWITLLLVVAGAVVGGLIAGPPGILLGMKAGLAASFAVGEFLLGSFLLGESITVIKILLELFTARQTQEQKHQDYVQATASFFGIVIALLFMLIFFLVSSIVSAVVSAIKGAFKAPTIKPPVTKPAPPPGPPKPVEPAPPGPANPAKPVEPPKPAEPGPPKPAEEPVPPKPAEEPVPPKPAEEPVPPKPPEEPVPPKPGEEPVPPKPGEEPVPPKPGEEPPKPGEEPPKPGEEPPKPEEPTGPGYEPWKAKGPDPNPNPGWGKGQIPCFPAGTLVSTPAGKQKIENIRTGDFVFAFDFASRSVVSKQVVDIYRGSTEAWINIFAGNSVLKATKNHPVWIVNESRWIASRDLAPGMILLLKNNQQRKVDRVENLELKEPASTFNLSVEGVNNYFAGEEEILVHNDDKTRLMRPGYKNYYLKDSAGNIYYEGMYGPEVTENQVRARHAKNNNRFNPSMGDDMVTLPGTRTYGDARRMEHERCVRNKTYIGRNGKNYRGNRQYPMNEDTFGRYYRTDAC